MEGTAASHIKGVLLSQLYYGELKLHAMEEPEETAWNISQM